MNPKINEFIKLNNKNIKMEDFENFKDNRHRLVREYKKMVLIRNTLKKVEEFPSDLSKYNGAKMHHIGQYKVLSDRNREITKNIVFKQFKPEGIFDFFDVFKEKIEKIDSVLDKVDVASNLVNSILPDIVELVNYVKSISENKNQIKMEIGLNFLSLVNGLNNISFSNNYLSTIVNLILLVIEFAKLLKNVCLFYLPTSNVEEEEVFYDVSFSPESLSALEALVGVGIVESLIPKAYKWLFTSMPLYTKTKILDEPNSLHDLFGWILDLPIKIAIKYHAPQFILDFLNNLVSSLPFSTLKTLVSSMSELISLHKEQYNLINDDTFVEKCNDLHKKYIEWANFSSSQLTNIPQTSSIIITKFLHLYNKIQHHSSLVRQEPYFLVFYGPKGTGKTTMMMDLVESLKENNSVYVHSSPSAEKDFYDMYDSEDVMVIDDLGQKGVFQWANMINFVSSTQCPLDCAAVDKKDVKRLNCKLILATTNNINLILTRSDPIQDVEALYRRMNVLDFSQVDFVDGCYSGHVHLKKRDPKKPEWVSLNSFDTQFNCLQDISNLIVDEVRKRLLYKQNIGIKRVVIPKLTAESFDISEKVLYGILGLVVTLWAKVMYTKLFSVEQKKEAVHSKSQIKKKFYQSVKIEKPLLSTFLPEYQKDLFLQQKTNIPVIDRMSQNVCVCRILDSDNLDLPVVVSCVVSGKLITTVRHSLSSPAINKKYWMKVYNGPSSLVYDSIQCKIIYISDSDDLIMFEIDSVVPTLFKEIPLVKQAFNSNLYLLTPQSSRFVDKLVELDMRQSYKKYNYKNYIELEDVAYFFRGDGFCGSLLVNEEGFILGHHIVGDKTSGVGVSKIWSKRSLEFLWQYKNSNVHFDILPNEIGNVVKLNLKERGTLVKNNTIVPSPLYGIYPVERSPANVQVFGNKTTYIQASKAFEDTSFVNVSSLEWASNVMRDILGPFQMQSLDQFFHGRNLDNYIDVSGSAGHGYSGTKADHLDKINCEFSPILRDRIVKVCKDANNGFYDFRDFSEDKLKIELRDNEKVDNPRVFTATPVSLYFFEKLFFGNLVEMLHNDHSPLGPPFKYLTGVMVGINPFSKDWPDMFSFLSEVGNVGFDGDVSKWDKKMLPQFQRSLNEILVSHLVSSDYNDKFVSLSQEGVQFLSRQILETLPSSVRIVGNDSFLTTHSLPSGRFLTADYNSLMNKFYNLYIYCELFKRKFNSIPTFQDYMRDVRIVVYGDDNIIGCRKEVLDWFNAFSYRDLMREMGMDYTPANKGEWKSPFVSLIDTQFLKRKFVYHHKLNCLVAPLDRTTMMSTLNFVSDSFRSDELIRLKLWNFQREAFLHYDYNEFMKYVQSYIKLNGFENFSFLSERELVDIYKRGDYGETIVFS